MKRAHCQLRGKAVPRFLHQLTLRLPMAFQWFLMALSVLPGSAREITDLRTATANGVKQHLAVAVSGFHPALRQSSFTPPIVYKDETCNVGQAQENHEKWFFEQNG
jgi:hypothetical protein